MVLVLEEGEGTTTTTTPAWSRTVTRGPGCRTTPMLPPLAPGKILEVKKHLRKRSFDGLTLIFGQIWSKVRTVLKY